MIRLGRRRANKDTDFASPGSIPEKVNNFCPPVIRHLIRNSLPKATFIHSISDIIHYLTFLKLFGVFEMVLETPRRWNCSTKDFALFWFLLDAFFENRRLVPRPQIHFRLFLSISLSPLGSTFYFLLFCFRILRLSSDPERAAPGGLPTHRTTWQRHLLFHSVSGPPRCRWW